MHKRTINQQHTTNGRQTLWMIERSAQHETTWMDTLVIYRTLLHTIAAGFRDPGRGLSVELETCEGRTPLSCSSFHSQPELPRCLSGVTASTLVRDPTDCWTFCCEMYTNVSSSLCGMKINVLWTGQRLVASFCSYFGCWHLAVWKGF